MSTESDRVESTLEEVNEVTKSLKVTIPSGMVEQEFAQAISDLAKTAQLKGFRPGKAPREMIEKAHGGRVRLEVANRLISSTLQDLIKEHKLDMVGMPDIDVANFEPGAHIEYTANISLFPHPTISNYEKFSVEVPERKIGDAQVEEVIERLRQDRATLKKIELRSTAREGDVLDTSVVVTAGDEEAARPEPVTFCLGKNTLPEEVEKALVGLEVFEKREVTTKISENHANEQMRGREVKYSVTLNGLYENIPPDLDDAFVKSLNLGAETLLELRLKVREQLEMENSRQSNVDVEAAILKQLVEAHQFLVPQVIIDDQIRTLLIRWGVIDPSKVDPSKVPVEQFRDKLGEPALERARTSIIVDCIAEQEKVHLEPKELEEAMAKTASDNAVSVEEVKKFFSDQRRLANYAIELTRNKVLEMLVSRADVKYVAAPQAEQQQEAPLE